MAFELPPLPNFQTNIPQIDPLQTYGRMLQLKALQGQQQLIPGQLQMQQQQIQEAQSRNTQLQQANQIQQMQIASMQARVKAWSDPDFVKQFMGESNSQLESSLGFSPGFDPLKMIRGEVSKGVNPDDAMKEASTFLELSKNLSLKTKDDLANYKASHEEAAKILAPILDMKAADAGPAFQAAKQKIASIPGIDPGDAQFVQQSSLDHVPALIQRLGIAGDLADFHKKQAEAAAAEQKVIPSSGGLSPESQQAVQKDIAVATNPQIQAGKVEVAKAEAASRQQIQLAMEPLRLQIQQQFQNQKDARDKIESNVLKPFQEKMTDVTMARTAISQALDNPVAARAAIFKMVGVAQPTGSHRVLPMEFTAFKYPGGIGDQIKERFNDFLKGEPWTPEIAQAANAFINGQEQSAHQSLNSGIDNTNKLYGTTVGGGLKQEQTDPFAPFGGKTRR